MISSPYDLGSVGALWQKPQLYAKFLGAELAFLYKGRLLIVMPNGYGLHHGKVSTAAERKLLAKVPIGQGGNGLTASAADAVRALAAASGHQLPKPAHKTSNAGRDRIVIAVVVVLVGLLVPALRAGRPPADGEDSRIVNASTAVWIRLAASVAALAAGAVAVVVVVLLAHGTPGA